MECRQAAGARQAGAAVTAVIARCRQIPATALRTPTDRAALPATVSAHNARAYTAMLASLPVRRHWLLEAEPAQVVQ
jgi:hypothetical protein